MARSAYDAAIRQLENQGNWVVVTLDEVKFEGDKNQKGRTLGHFAISVRNTLPVPVKITDIDWRVPPQDWNKDWIFKEFGFGQGKNIDRANEEHASTIRKEATSGFISSGGEQRQTLPLEINCCKPVELKNITVDVATNPVSEYCKEGKENLQFWINVSLEDKDTVPYRQLYRFEAYCVTSKEGQTIFRWNPI